jgi:RecA-family ATPase
MNLEWALHYANRGWTVFPLDGETKVSHTWRGEQHGPERWGATRDPVTIRNHFAPYPNAGIGIPTGVENGFWVIETDTKNGKDGEGELAKLQAQHEPLPTTYRVRSPSGSIHYYFAHPGPDFYITSRSDKIAPGIDIKGNAGMVVGPPTARGGKRYEIIDNVPIVEAPQWLLALVTRKITDDEKRFVKHAPPTDEPTVEPWEIAKLERWVREALEKNLDWFAERENALKTVWGIKRAGYGREGYRIAQLICEHEAFPETQPVARVDRFWNDRDANRGTASLDTFWKMCSESGIKNTAEEQNAWRQQEGNQVIQKLAAHAAALVPGTTTTESRRTLRDRRVSAASLAGKAVPEREWLVPGWIPMEQVTLLYGDGAVGKSLATLQLATSTGKFWFGLPVKQGAAEYITAEDSEGELHRRLAEIARETRQPLESMTGVNVSSFADEDAIMAALTGDGQLVKTAFYDEVVAVVNEVRPVLLVLDTLADIYGGNEVIRAQARAFVNMLRKIAIKYQLAVVVLAHPSLSGMSSGKGTSGSTGWSNSVRSRLYFDRVYDEDGIEADTDARVLRSMKMNYGSVGNEIHMRWRAGIFVAENGSAAGPDPLVQGWKAERVFLDLLDKANERNTFVNASRQANNYAPKVFATDALKQGVKKRDLVDAMHRLLDGGKIENAPYGPVSRTVYRLQRIHRPAMVAPPLAPLST